MRILGTIIRTLIVDVLSRQAEGEVAPVSRQLGGLFKVYSDCHSYRQNLLGQIFLSLLLR